MHLQRLLIGFLLASGMAQAQVVSPLGGSTTNPQSPPPATATRPARPAPMSAAPNATGPAGAPAITPPGTSPAVTPGAGAGTAPRTATHARRTLTERFEAANTSHDGKLTLDQAKAGRLRAVSRDFDKIDRDKRGYVTLDQVKAFQSEQRTERRAARSAKPH